METDGTSISSDSLGAKYMKRFQNNEPDDFFDKDYMGDIEDMTDDDDDDETYEEFTSYLDESDLKALISSQIEEITDNRENNLILAINLAQNKLLWKFYTEKMQMASIKRIFNELMEITKKPSS